MLGVRVTSFSEGGLGEPEQDANSALTELDKGLRSGKIGEQCEAIVRFPKLFEKYPFPILINASFLKLAEVFRTGSNFLRLCVLRVCQQSEKHLDKISNVDEFVRRVFSVMHSNDPIARALTLRTIGAVAGIIPERQQVHHSIRRSLDSHDTVEVEAAIYAAMQFAAQSKSFAISMCNKVSDMIQGQATPANMKLQLIPILQYMHHDTNTAAMVRQVCIDLLPSYPAQDFVLVTLNTLTQLAAATLVDVANQVLLLLQYLTNDPRWEVKSRCLQHLHQLAKPGAHLWPKGAINTLIDVALKSEAQKVLSLSLGVLQVLAESPVLCHEHRLPGSVLQELCIRSSYSPNPAIAAKAIEVLTRILCYSYKEGVQDECAENVISSLEALILLLTNSDAQQTTKYLRVTLKCAVNLCEANPHHCKTFVDILSSRLETVDGTHNITICEALGAIGGVDPDTLIPLRAVVIRLLSELSEIPNATAQQTQTKVMLCTLICQAMSGYEWNAQTDAIVAKVVATNNLWANYRIARAAARYGHHRVALDIFNGLTERVSSEHLHFWLVCLKEMCEAEAQLNDSDTTKIRLVRKLNQATVHYNKAFAALKAASTPTHHLQFQAEYVRIRTEFLQCLVQLIHTSDGLCTVPPPAIASTIVQSTRDELQRHGYVTNQLRKCAKEFKACAEMYWKLYQSAFDADPATLENIQILQQMCNILEQSIESICVSGNKIDMTPIEYENQSKRLESRQLLRGCAGTAQIAQILAQDSKLQTITHKHVDYLVAQVQIISNAALSVPRYFFQTLQSTTVKLAISPQPRIVGEFISVQAGSQFAVKVEGVIQHGKWPGLFRGISGIIVTVTSQHQPGTNRATTSGYDTKSSNNDTCPVLTQTVTPHRDFFTAQFLLAFSQGGAYNITVEASVIDEQDNTWKTGPRSTLQVKVPEESKSTPIPIPGSVGNVILVNDVAQPNPNVKPTK